MKKVFHVGATVRFQPETWLEWKTGKYAGPAKSMPGWHLVRGDGESGFFLVPTRRLELVPHSHAGGPDTDCPECVIRELTSEK